jgi:predicted transglutaminase-like cysteine proteinase
MATVLDKRVSSHAVLVLRTGQGDYVLDNATNQILPWTKTGYTFLKLQDPKRKSTWRAVMEGGLFSRKAVKGQ